MIGANINKTDLVCDLLMKGNANDSSGNGNDFTTTASLTTDKLGRSNRAYDINHRDKRLIINNDIIDYTSDWSVSIWACQTVLASPNAHRFIISSRNAVAKTFTLRIDKNTNNVRCYVYDGSNIVDTGAIANAVIDTDFHNYIVQYKVATKTLFLYLDAVLIEQSTSANAITNDVQTGFMELGGQGIQPSSVSETKIGQFKVFQRCLSDFEIKQLFMNSQLLEN